jgi:hypothetical protein
MSDTFMLLKADGESFVCDIEGKDYPQFNAAIGADTGAVVRSRGLTAALMDGGGRRLFGCDSVDLWVDDEALMKPEPKVNVLASVFAAQLIHGDALVMLSNAGGESMGLPLEVEYWLMGVIADLMRNGKADAMLEQVRKEHEEWMRETNGTGIKVTVWDETDDKKGGAA